jgi:MarR family transcriptional regulator for hemolysin
VGIPLGQAVGRTAKLMRQVGDRRLATLGATVTDWILLLHIADAPPPGLSQAEVARFSDMSGPALVRHLDRMAEDGIIVRTRDAADRRISRITLTPAGQRRRNELRAVMEDMDRELRSMLSENEQRVMVKALDKLFTWSLAEVQGREVS